MWDDYKLLSPWQQMPAAHQAPAERRAEIKIYKGGEIIPAFSFFKKDELIHKKCWFHLLKPLESQGVFSVFLYD
jgi:hypothetical protein